MNDFVDADEFLKNNAYLQGVPAHVLQVCTQISQETGREAQGALEMLSKKLENVSIQDDPETVLREPLLQ